MLEMTHRERVMAALNHRQPDRTPIDFGGTFTTTIFQAAYERLKDHLGLEHETGIYSKTRRLAVPDVSGVERVGVDTRMGGLVA